MTTSSALGNHSGDDSRQQLRHGADPEGRLAADEEETTRSPHQLLPPARLPTFKDQVRSASSSGQPAPSVVSAVGVPVASTVLRMKDNDASNDGTRASQEEELAWARACGPDSLTNQSATDSLTIPVAATISAEDNPGGTAARDDGVHGNQRRKRKRRTLIVGAAVVLCLLGGVAAAVALLVGDNNPSSSSRDSGAPEAPPAGVSFETAKLAPGDARGSQRFGGSVALAGAILVVGAARDLENGSESGAAYVFERVAGDTGQEWSETVKLVPNDASALDQFGGSAAVDDDGTALVLGAAGAEGRRGAAYVFVRTTSDDDAWTQQARLSPSSDGELHFGRSVALAGDTAVVGAPGDGEQLAGSAHVYVRTGSVWTEQAVLTPTGGNLTAGASFGYSVAIDQDTVVVGAFNDDVAAEASGSAFVFVRSSDGSWTQQAQLVHEDAAFRDLFGESVAVAGDLVAIGSVRDDDQGEDSGSVYTFVRTTEAGSAASWTQQTKLFGSNSASNDVFGESVALFNNTLVVGADQSPNGGAGMAYVFRMLPNATWVEETILMASEGENDDRFGNVVAISGDQVVVGAPWDDDNGDRSGSVYVYEWAG